MILFLFLFLGKGVYLGWAAKAQDAAGAYEKAISDGLRALALFAISAWLVWAAVRKRKYLSVLPFILAGVVFIDFWMISRRFMAI